MVENTAFCHLQLRDPISRPRIRLRNPKLADPDLVFGPGGQVSILENSAVATSPAALLPPQTLQQDPSVLTPAPSADQTTALVGWQSDMIPISQHQATFQGSTIRISRFGDTTSTLASPPTGNIPVEISSRSPSGFPVTSQSYMTQSGSAFALTSTASPSSSLSSSSFSMSTLTTPTVVSVSEPRHSAFFYGIIVFAVLVGISIATAIIAWWIRLRRHAQRRLDDASLHIPWANHNNFDKLEEARSPDGFSGSAGANTSLHCSELIGMGRWAPLDDVDVVQSGSFQQPNLFSTEQTDQARKTFHPNSGNGPIFRFCQRPSSEGIRSSATRTATASDSVHQEHSNLGPLQVMNLTPGDVATTYDSSWPGTGRIGYSGDVMLSEFGTPREAVAGSKPRFLCLEGQSLALPRAPLQPRCNQRKFVMANRDHLQPLPFPGEIHQSESWAESIKANLIHAFNAATGNLIGTGPTLEGDNLTTIPSRSSRHSRSFLNSDSSKPIDGVEAERQQGAGTIHMLNNGPGKQYDKNLVPFPQDLSEASARDDLSTVYSPIESLIRTQRPPIAVTGLFGRRDGTVTRSSSVYSTSSARYTHDLHMVIPSFSRKHSRESRMMKLPSNPNVIRPESVNKSRLPRPETMMRVSSTGCSATSFCSESARASEQTEGEEQARVALRERRMDCGKKLQKEF